MGPLAGADLVHESPLTLVPSFPLHQVPGHFSSGGGADLVHEFPLTLVPPFPLHQVRAIFSPSATEDLVHESPLTLVPSFTLHQVPGHFSSGAGADLVHEIPLALVLSFPLHQVRAVFPLRAVEGEASGRRRTHESPGLHTQPGAFPILILFIYFAVALSTRNCPTFSWKKYSSKLFSFA